MKQLFIKKGEAYIDNVPSPRVDKGTVLVKVEYSCISIGTEMSSIKSSETPLWKRALTKGKLKKTIEIARKTGLNNTKKVIEAKVSSGKPSGYSATGTVIEVGEGISDIKPGDRVACAGAKYANHAEVINVPRNLVVLLPDNVDMSDASTITLGAIALQGVRRTNPTLGECFVVIGLGIIGQLTVQILKANGCKVIGVDIDKDRIDIAQGMGMDVGVHPNDNEIMNVKQLTGGIGADGVIITASTLSNQVVSTAFKMCRKKGRVTLVGNVGLNLNRVDFYEKEIDFFISSSYGPGRYDNNYEEKGLDYPISYVRWTENRNMLEYINLLSNGKINVRQLIGERFSILEASKAYSLIKNESNKPLLVILTYPQKKKKFEKVIFNEVKPLGADRKINISLIGAGSFIKGTHLPNLNHLNKYYYIHSIMSRTGYNAKTISVQYNAKYATSDYDYILKDSDIDMVLIGTRHNLHAEMVKKALQARKHVFVEKPLALNQTELNQIISFFDKNDNNNILMTGFNRRFSPLVKRINKTTSKRTNPMIINYTMNAGYLTLDHWVHGEEGGGRNIGEACHIYDLMTFLTNSKIESIDAKALKPKTGYYQSNDNFITNIKFKDGSVCSLTYTALGSKEYEKERMEIFVDGKAIILKDYKTLEIFNTKKESIIEKVANKGHKEMLKDLAMSIQQGGEWPIPLWQQVQAMEISYEVEKLLKE